MSDTQGGGPLVGLRVMEFTRGRAGAIAGMLLADYGAEVLRVEPPGGDPLWDDLPGYPVWHRGKEIVQIDLTAPEAIVAIARRLPVTDVLLDGMRPGVLAAAGLGYEAVAPTSPALVYASVSGFGGVVDAPGYEGLVQAWLGLPSYQGARRGSPSLSTYAAGSFGAALLTVIGILAALHQRDRSERGQRVETSLLDGLLAQLVMNLVAPAGEEPGPPPMPGASPTMAIYACGDDTHLQIHLGARGALERLCEAMGMSHADFVGERTGRHFAGDPEGADRFRAALARVFAERPRREWIEILTAADVPVAACLAPGEILDHPQTQALDLTMQLRDPLLGPLTCAAPPIHFDGSRASRSGAALQRGMPRNPEAALRHTGWLPAEEIAAAETPRLGTHHGDVGVGPEPQGGSAGTGEARAPADPPDSPTGSPLAGLRVLDFGMFAAGPYAAMLLAELGADVIKIEPPAGDTMRPNARPFSGLHRGKRGLALDLKSEHASEVVHALVDSADVLLHNFRPGVAERLGLGATDTLGRNPRLVHFHSSGFGSTGPLVDQPGFDQIYQAFCGMSVLQGGPGNAPEQVVGAPLDCLNALLTAAGVLMALRHRAQTGEGQHAECAQWAAGLLAVSDVYRTASGTTEVPLDRERRALADGYRIERASDGWLFVCCPDEDAATRLGALSAADALPWNTRTVDGWLEVLAGAQIPAAALRVPFDDRILLDPALVDAGRVIEVDDPVLGRVCQPGGFLRFSEAVLPPVRGGPALGAHTHEILRDLGFAEEEISRLIATATVIEGKGT